MKSANIKNGLGKSNVLTCIFFFLLFAFAPTVFSQTCLPPGTNFYRHFPQGNTNDFNSGVVHYFFENIPNGTQRSQIETGINNWEQCFGEYLF